MAAPTLSLTESQVQRALRTFLLGALPVGTDVIRGQVNRVPEPAADDFVVFWPLRQERLGTNVVTYSDDVLTASIAGTVLTVTSVNEVQAGPLADGTVLLDEASLIAVDTVIQEQLSGSTGGTGTYRVSKSQTLASGTVFAGTRRDLTPVQLTVQLDVHGPRSGDNSVVIAGLFRSEYGTIALADLGLELAPLYCSDPQQLPFVNAEQQYEDRWTIDASLQINPTIGTSQRFADRLSLSLVAADEL